MSIWDISRHLVVVSLQMPLLPGFGVCISGAVLRRTRQMRSAFQPLHRCQFSRPPGPVGSVPRRLFFLKLALMVCVQALHPTQLN